jgi:hypothetical protein
MTAEPDDARQALRIQEARGLELRIGPASVMSHSVIPLDKIKTTS